MGDRPSAGLKEGGVQLAVYKDIASPVRPNLVGVRNCDLHIAKSKQNHRELHGARNTHAKANLIIRASWGELRIYNARLEDDQAVQGARGFNCVTRAKGEMSWTSIF